MGQAAPLVRPSPILCPEIHGDSGLDGPDGGRVLPKSSLQCLPGKAVNVMFDHISAAYKQSAGTKIRKAFIFKRALLFLRFFGNLVYVLCNSAHEVMSASPFSARDTFFLCIYDVIVVKRHGILDSSFIA